MSPARILAAFRHHGEACGSHAAAVRSAFVCSYAHITNCSESVFATTAMRPCYTCGELGMHHHFCALDDKARGRADDPGGPGTS
eukprot:2052932-Pleurochrysis_carterae.AAC.1